MKLPEFWKTGLLVLVLAGVFSYIWFVERKQEPKKEGEREKVTVVKGVVDFPASVNFNAFVRQVVPGPTGFPPEAAQTASVGDAGYSPLIELPDGTIENAPQVAIIGFGGGYGDFDPVASGQDHCLCHVLTSDERRQRGL